MLRHHSQLVQTLLGTGLTWGVTALGAAFCAFQPTYAHKQNRLLDISLGFSAGVMLAASFWSLLDPAIEISRNELRMGYLSVFPAALGLILGAAFVGLVSRYLPTTWLEPMSKSKADMEQLSPAASRDSPTTATNDEFRGGDCSLPNFGLRLRKPHDLPSTTVNLPVTSHNPRYMTRRLWLLMIAVTVHNIPEGFAVGVAFGGIGKYKRYTFTDARNLAIGIAIQNFPEGLSVSLPLRAAGYSFYKSLWYGQLSGLVEPLAGLIGCIAVQFIRKFQPYALGFAAGAMLFVVFDDVIPEAQSRQNGRLASIAAVMGFLVMMCLDVITT